MEPEEQPKLVGAADMNIVTGSRTRRPRVLFVAPITPASSGNGLAMRAGLFLDALCSACDVSVLQVPVAGPATAWPRFVLDRSLAQLCLRLSAPPAAAALDREPPHSQSIDLPSMERRLLPFLSQFTTNDSVMEARLAFQNQPPFDIVLGSRLYLAPFVAAFRDACIARPRTILDLDDDEVTTRQSIAALYDVLGSHALADAERTEADKYRLVEERWLRSFDQICVGSERDRERVAARTRHGAVRVVPNGVAMPPSSVAGGNAQSAIGAPVRLLFVGTLSYAPNVDAAVALCRDILPELRARVASDVCVDLVGSQPAASVRELTSISGVTIHADVADVGPFYRRADVAVVPLRAGGGTRVKILEAFAHGVPVVSTSIGAEGLRVVPERHLLIADGPREMGDACARLLGNPELADRLRTDAHALVASEYEISIIAQRIRALLPVDATHPTFHNPRHGRELGAEESGRPRGE